MNFTNNWFVIAYVMISRDWKGIETCGRWVCNIHMRFTFPMFQMVPWPIYFSKMRYFLTLHCGLVYIHESILTLKIHVSIWHHWTSLSSQLHYRRHILAVVLLIVSTSHAIQISSKLYKNGAVFTCAPRLLFLLSAHMRFIAKWTLRRHMQSSNVMKKVHAQTTIIFYVDRDV